MWLASSKSTNQILTAHICVSNVCCYFDVQFLIPKAIEIWHQRDVFKYITPLPYTVAFNISICICSQHRQVNLSCAHLIIFYLTYYISSTRLINYYNININIFHYWSRCHTANGHTLPRVQSVPHCANGHTLPRVQLMPHCANGRTLPRVPSVRHRNNDRTLPSVQSVSDCDDGRTPHRVRSEK